MAPNADGGGVRSRESCSCYPRAGLRLYALAGQFGLSVHLIAVDGVVG